MRSILRKLATTAGVADLSLHDLRRTYIANLLDAGTDISVLQRLAGYANIPTALRYERWGEVNKRVDADRLQVPEIG